MFPCNPDIGAVKGLVTRFSAMIRSCRAPCFHNNRHLAGAKASGYGQLFLKFLLYLNTVFGMHSQNLQNSTMQTWEISFGVLIRVLSFHVTELKRGKKD